MKNKLSVALATYNEESNIARCLSSVKELADEIVIVDGTSTDNTVEIAKRFDAKVISVKNDPMFHVMKQKAMDSCKSEWILQLDADEEVSASLKREIELLLNMTAEEMERYQARLPNKRLFVRHQKLIESRDGRVGDLEGELVAFFIPRLNYFLGKYLRYGGVYPDGVIRLFKRGKAYLPCKSVHEQMIVNGRVGWLSSPLFHKDSPTFKRYLERNNRYIAMLANEFQEQNLPKTIFSGFKYLLVKPIYWVLLTTLRHKGILDGYQGVVFSVFSALRFPRAYLLYLKDKND